MKRQTVRRSKGTGSLFKRNGKFVYQWTCVTGKLKTKTLDAHNQDDAQKEVEKIRQGEIEISSIESKVAYIRKIAEVKALLHICKEPIEKIEEVFFAHPSAPEISPHHRGNYHSVLQRLIRFTSDRGVKTVADVTEEIAQEFLSYNWKRGISAKTYNSNLDVLKRVFRLLSKDQNPFSEFKKKSGVTEMRQAFTVEQLQQLWATLQSPDFHMLYKNEMAVLYKLALYTGARCGDLCLLKWNAVDLENRLIHFIPHKTAHSSCKRVEIPMSDVLYTTLNELPQTDIYVLPKVAERYQHNPSGISSDTKKLIEAAGFQAIDKGESRRIRNVSRLGFHAFRHSYVSMLINNGVNPLVVRDLVGHTSVDMTARYTHINLETKREALQNLKVLPSLSLSESSAQEKTESLADIFMRLSPTKLETVGRWLEENLMPEQKHKLGTIFLSDI